MSLPVKDVGRFTVWPQVHPFAFNKYSDIVRCAITLAEAKKHDSMSNADYRVIFKIGTMYCLGE